MVQNTASAPLTGEMFRISTSMDHSTNGLDLDDVTLPQQNRQSTLSSIDWTTGPAAALVVNRFTTGEWDASEDAEKLLAADVRAQHKMMMLKTQKMVMATGSKVQYKPQQKNVGFYNENGDDVSGEEADDENIGSMDDDHEASSGEVDDEYQDKKEEVDDPLKDFEKVSFYMEKFDNNCVLI